MFTVKINPVAFLPYKPFSDYKHFKTFFFDLLRTDGDNSICQVASHKAFTLKTTVSVPLSFPFKGTESRTVSKLSVAKNELVGAIYTFKTECLI